MIFVQQYGLQRSGTCYINWLINNNFSAICALTGNKHKIPRESNTVESANFDNIHLDVLNLKGCVNMLLESAKEYKLKYIINIKHPYSWIVSWFRYSKEEITNESIVKNINCWNKMNTEYIKFYNHDVDKCILIKHDELINEQDYLLNKLYNKFKLKKQKYVIKHGYRKHDYQMSTGYSPTPLKFNKEYYNNFLYLNELLDFQIDIINETIDLNVIKKLQFVLK